MRVLKPIIRDSKGEMIDYQDNGRGEQRKDNRITVNTINELYAKVYVIRAAINTLVDAVVRNGYVIYNNGNEDEKTVERMKELRFDVLLKILVNNCLRYGGHFTEVKKNSRRVTELNTLEFEFTEIRTNKHGKILGYFQEPQSGEIINWMPEEVVYTVLSHSDTNVWGDTDLSTAVSLSEQLLDAMHYIHQLFAKNKLRGWFNLPTGGNAIVQRQFKEDMIDFENDSNYERFLITTGEWEYKVLETFENGDKILNYIEKVENQLLSLLRVPAIMANITTNSNRSSADAEVRNTFFGRVMAIQKSIEDEITRELMPHFGKGLVFKFNIPDSRFLKEHFEIVKTMKDTGIKTTIISDYLRRVGVQLPSGDVFEKIENQTLGSPPSSQSGESSNKGSPIGSSKDTFMKERKSGEESTTREDQIVRDRFYIEEGNIIEGDYK